MQEFQCQANAGSSRDMWVKNVFETFYDLVPYQDVL